jgi:hypothetical protein
MNTVLKTEIYSVSNILAVFKDFYANKSRYWCVFCVLTVRNMS